MQCGTNWQPSQLIRPVLQLPTSTKPLLVVTDAGDAVIKFMGNPMGYEALAFDLVGTELARWIGLKTPDFATMPVRDIPSDWCDAFDIENGPAFLSRYLPALTYEGGTTFLDRLADPDDIAKLVVFDTWVCNEDRYPPDIARGDLKVNLDNLLFSRSTADPRRQKFDLLAFDHTHAFSDIGFAGLQDEAQILSEAVYGLFPAFKPFLTQTAIDAATERLRQIDRAELWALLDAIPPEWGVTLKLKSVRRAHLVAGGIKDKILFQQELWKGGDEVG